MTGFKNGNPGCECCAGSGTGTITIPGCPCASQPTTITQTFVSGSDPNHVFNSCTYVYGPTPAPLLAAVLTANSYLSTASFFDPILGVNFQYLLFCGGIGGSKYLITRVYVATSLGSPFRDSVRFSFTAGFPGNQCSGPWEMLNGVVYSGGDPATVIHLT